MNPPTKFYKNHVLAALPEAGIDRLRRMPLLRLHQSEGVRSIWNCFGLFLGRYPPHQHHHRVYLCPREVSEPVILPALLLVTAVGAARSADVALAVPGIYGREEVGPVMRTGNSKLRNTTAWFIRLARDLRLNWLIGAYVIGSTIVYVLFHGIVAVVHAIAEVPR